MNSSTVDCPVIDVSASQALGSCSSGAKTSTLTITNSDSANDTAYVLVEYSLDGGSSWTEKEANQSVAKNASATLTHSVPSTWQTCSLEIQDFYNIKSFTGSYSTWGPSYVADCPTVDVSVSATLGTCQVVVQHQVLQLQTQPLQQQQRM
jgi:hypothetical protein